MSTINLPNEECRRGAIAAFQVLLKLDANADNRDNCGDEAGDFFRVAIRSRNGTG